MRDERTLLWLQKQRRTQQVKMRAVFVVNSKISDGDFSGKNKYLST